MTTHKKYGISTTITEAEFDDWAKFARTNDVRLPDPATALDVCRSLYKLAKRATTESRSTELLRSTDSQPVSDGTVLVQRTTTESELLSDTETSNRIKLAGAAESLLDKRIALERQRTETARWKAQAT